MNRASVTFWVVLSCVLALAVAVAELLAFHSRQERID